MMQLKKDLNKGINVLSLFDGMSCGRVALERAGIKVDNYFASEIDKYTIQVTKHNYPNTKHIGDVTQVKGADLPKIDLLCGGSPCQGFSFAGKQLNFDDPRSKLFFEFVRLLEETKPRYFLLENVKMKKTSQDIISGYLGVEPILINSALVSAQNRKRLYWTNIPNITQPKDKGIVLRDIWNGGEEITERVKKKPLGTSTYRNTWKNMVTLNDKSKCLTASGQNISNASCTNVDMNGRYYKLTPVECERLQTIPDKEINCIFVLCEEQVKNYVNAVEQNPKLLKLALSAEKEKLNEFVKLAIQNTKQSNPKTKFIVPQNVGMQTQSRIKQCIASNQNENNTTVSNVENIVMSKNQEQEVDSVLQNAFINITEGRIMHFGKEELPLKDKSCTRQLSGNKPLKLSGKEMMELVRDVGVGMKKNNDMSSTYTTLSVLSTNSIEQMLSTYYLFAKSAITGYTQDIINQKNISVQFKVNEGYTKHVSNTQRYKMLGNAWTVDVIAHIFKNIS